MTTQIIVNANCGEDKEVEIKVTDKEGSNVITLQDGESMDNFYVYDEREISVKEVEK